MRRRLRKFGLGVLVALAVLMGLLVGAWLFFTSPPGERIVRDAVLQRLNQTLPGNVDVATLAVDNTTVVLTDVVLRDPEGKVVARIPRVEATLGVMSLLKGKVEILRARVERPELWLVLGEDGLNLTRALRTAKQTQPSQGARLTLVLRDVELDGGRVDLQQSTIDGLAHHLRLENLRAKDALTLDGKKDALEGELALSGTFAEPAPGPLSLSATFERSPERTLADLSLGVGGGEVVLHVQGEGTEQERFELRSAKLPREAMAALLPGWPLIADVTAAGTVTRNGNLAQVDLRARAGTSEVALSGGVDVARLRVEALTLNARGVDFSQLVEDGPKSKVELTLRATGGGTSLQTLDAQVDLSVPSATLEKQTLGPIELHASAKDGAFELSELDVQLPGASLTARGGGTLEAMKLQGRLHAANLATLGGTLGRVVKPGGLPLSGKGSLAFTAVGPPTHPGVSVSGKFASLQYDALRAQHLSLDAKLEDVRRPLDADAELAAGRLRVADRNFRNVLARVATRGRELKATLTAQGATDVALNVGGTVDADRQGLRLAALELRYPEAVWKLQRPSHLRFADGDLSFGELTLEAGRQRLTLNGGVRNDRLDVRGQIENLELARLPRALVGGTLQLGGEVDARVKALGTTRRPDVAAQLTLRHGRVNTFRDLALELDGRYAKDRAQGELKARAFESAVVGNFDLPVRGLLEGTQDAVALDLAIEPTGLDQLFAALQVKPGLTGFAAARVHLSGTAAQPYVRIAVDGDHVKQENGPEGDLDLVVESSKDDGTLSARIDLDTMASQNSIVLNTPLRPRQLLDQRITPRLFLETPATLEAAFRDVPVEALQAWGLVAADFRGRTSLTVNAHGTVRAPVGKVHLAIKGAAMGDVQPFDTFATVDAGEEKIALTLTAVRGQQRLVDLGGNLAASLEELFKRHALDTVPVAVEGEVGPLRLRELQLMLGGIVPQEEEGTAHPDGILTAHLALSGTPANPTARLTGVLEQLGLGRAALGKVDVRYDYQAARSTARVELTSPKGGKLTADARLEADLSSRGLRRGIEWKKAPLQARLVSKDFDPAFLSSVTPLVREIGGPLDADATLGGVVGAPQLRGRVEWKKGRLALMGYGNYQDLHLLVKGNNDAIALEDLSAHAGGGELHVTARADRAGDRFTLTGKGTVTDFPVVSDDQLQALVSGRFNFKGEASPELVLVRDLSIPEAHVQLPEVRRKDLQELDRPKDIVLVRKGEPLYKRRKPGSAVAQGAAQPSDGGAPAAGEAARPEGGRAGPRYTILVNAPRNIWVRSSDVNAELGLSDGFRIDIADQTLLFGEVRFLRGRVDVLGRRFDVLKDSQIRFAGPAALPYINVTAEHANEREEVTVFTTVRGQGKDVTLKVSSTPALSESEIYTLLATGRRTLKRGSGASMSGAEAASVVGSYAASQVKKVLANKVPVDVLSIEAGESGLSDASVEAGTYLTDKVYVGSILRLSANPEENENRAGVRLEYQFTPRWSFQFEYGTAQRGGADLIWSRDY